MKQLADEAGVLVRQEVALAKAEMREKAGALRAEAEARAAAATQELDAARGELANSGRRAGIGAGMVIGAAAFALVALGVLAALLARLLDSVMPDAAALAIVVILYLAVAGGLAALGLNRLRRAAQIAPTSRVQRLIGHVKGETAGDSAVDEAWPPVPEQTIETLKEDMEWLKHPTRSAGTSSRRGNG